MLFVPHICCLSLSLLVFLSLPCPPPHSFVSELELERSRLSSTLGLDPAEPQLTFSTARGYHLSLPTAALLSLPPQHREIFIQAAHRGRRTFCTTEHFLSLDARQAEAFSEIAMMAGRAVEDVLEAVRERQTQGTASARRPAKSSKALRSAGIYHAGQPTEEAEPTSG